MTAAAAARVPAPGAAGGLPLWFTEFHHAGAAIPAVTLAAYAGGNVLPGSVVTPRPGALVGQVRWQLRSGLVEDLTVVPVLRGRGVEGLLAAAAAALAGSRGWPAPHGDLRTRAPGPRAGVERLVGDLPARLL